MDLNYEKTFDVKIIKNENLTDLFLELELFLNINNEIIIKLPEIFCQKCYN